MKVRLFILLAILTGASAAHGQANKELSKSEQEVRKLERAWLDAYEKLDGEAMDGILSDNFKLTFSNGSDQTKADIFIAT